MPTDGAEVYRRGCELLRIVENRIGPAPNLAGIVDCRIWPARNLTRVIEHRIGAAGDASPGVSDSLNDGIVVAEAVLPSNSD